MSQPANTRAFITLSIFLTFSVMMVTSVLMFINRHSDATAMLHTVLGFSILVLALWHMKNNFGPLVRYFKNRRSKAGRLNWALPVATIMSTATVLLSLIQFGPFMALYEWGNILRTSDIGKEAIQSKITYIQIDNSTAEALGAGITIDFRKGSHFTWPQYAIWLETMEGEFVQPLFITSKLANNNFVNKVSKKNAGQVLTSNPFTSEELDFRDVFDFIVEPASKRQRLRPESLPVFLHQLGLISEEGVRVPTKKDVIADSYTGATILDNFLYTSKTDAELHGEYRLRFEINQSFDFNAYYSSDRFPNDAIYSGNGYSAQPSVIYEAIIDFCDQQRFYVMSAIGHGHHSGKNGGLYPNLDQLSTALDVVDRIIVEVDVLVDGTHIKSN